MTTAATTTALALLALVGQTLPRLADPARDAALRSPRTVHYDDRTIPRAYAHAGGFHSPSYNISADPTDSGLRHGEGGNANVQFPWRVGGGLDHSPGVRSAKALTLPEAPGGVWPVVAWQGRLPGHPGMGPESATRWRFPRGAILWEILSHDVGGSPMVFEVRARIRQHDYWDTSIYRPFPRCADLADELTRRGVEPAAVAELRAPAVLTVVDHSDRANRTRPAFVGRAAVAWMPRLPVPLVAELLRDTPFADATGTAWATSGELHCYAPTTDTAGQLVPIRYAGTIVGTDTDSCAKCHDGVARHARRFDAARGWYGHVRGDDGIFSFHPIDPARISRNGATIQPLLNRHLVEAGIVSAYDPARHPGDIYNALAP